MPTHRLIICAGFLVVAAGQTALSGQPALDDVPPALTGIMDGAGPSTDTFISPQAEFAPIDAVTFRVTNPFRLLSARTLSNTFDNTPQIIDVIHELDDDAGSVYTVLLDAPIPVAEWTRVSLDVESTIELVDEGDRVATTLVFWLAHLPGDINLDGKVDIRDATAFGQVWREQSDAVLIDLNADGVVDEFDVAAFRETWHGGNPSFRAYRNVSLPSRPTDCNHNGVDDLTDILAGSHDQNENGIPDSCERGQ